MSDVIIIGCRLPCGVVIEHGGKTVTLAGQNQEKSGIILLGEDDYGQTLVDKSFWDEWKKAHANFQPLTSGAIFEAKTPADAKAKQKELKGEKTGHEPMKQTEGNIKPEGE